MNNEIIKTMDEQSKKIYDELTNLEEMYATAKSENKGARHLNQIAEYHNKLLTVYNEIKQDKKNYKALAINLETNPELQSSMDKYTEHLTEKYLGIKKEQNKDLAVVDNKPLEKAEDAQYEEVERESKINKGKVISWLSIIAACVMMFALGRGCSKTSKNESKEPVKTSEPAKPKETPSSTATLVDGAYGTFMDATDDKQVEARANYIYNNYFKETINKIGSNNNEYAIEITPESIANVIRVYNDELPIENGYKNYDNETINYYVTLANKMYSTLFSDERLGYIGYAPMSMLLEDNSQARYLADIFDKDYKAIADARNNETEESSLNAIKALGYDLRDRLLIFGLQGEITPMSVRDHGNGAYTSAMGRFASYVLEWNLSNKKAACIPVCTDYETGKEQEWPVTKIYETIETGEYNNIVAKMTGSGIVEDSIGKILFEQHDDALRSKYELEKGKAYTLTK